MSQRLTFGGCSGAIMTDITADLIVILTDCLRLSSKREDELRSHAARLLASIKAGSSTDAFEKTGCADSNGFWQDRERRGLHERGYARSGSSVTRFTLSRWPPTEAAYCDASSARNPLRSASRLLETKTRPVLIEDLRRQSQTA